MNQSQIVLVQQSYETMRADAATVAAGFYATLFARNPELRPLFRGNLAEQGDKLMAMIGVAVHGLTRLETIVGAVEQLGRRHAGYGVQPEHYAMVGSALLETLRNHYGAAFTADVEHAWASAYGLLAGVMEQAAAQPAA
jgi:nitric oxide dioxygenase